MENRRSQPVRALRAVRWAAAVVTLGVLLVVSGQKLAAAPASPHPAHPAHPAHPEVYVVAEGDTLWELAAEFAPDEDPRRFVQEAADLNGLRSSTIIPGQRLFLPAQ